MLWYVDAVVADCELRLREPVPLVPHDERCRPLEGVSMDSLRIVCDFDSTDESAVYILHVGDAVWELVEVTEA